MKKIDILNRKIIKKLNKKLNLFQIYYVVNIFLYKNLEIEQYMFFKKKNNKFDYFTFLNDIYEKLKILDELKKYSSNKIPKLEISNNELRHKKIYNSVWQLYTYQSFINERIPRYVNRIKINNLKKYIKDKRIIDFGCGHGNFLIACKQFNSNYSLGIDYGKDSIKYANQIKKRMGYDNKDLEYKNSTVYNVPAKSDSFDFAIQNGVFHHLNNPLKAFKEVHRVLKLNGFFWTYTAGDENGVYLNFCDLSRKVISIFDSKIVLKILQNSHVSQNKLFDIYDIFYGKYLRKNKSYYFNLLKKIGFGNFKILKGGQITDFDYKEKPNKNFKYKFGNGELRILCQKINK